MYFLAAVAESVTGTKEYINVSDTENPSFFLELFSIQHVFLLNKTELALVASNISYVLVITHMFHF
jgi:hypothetical protein